MRQPLQVVQRGAAPAVNALVVVAHGSEAPAFAHQQLEHLVLRGIGVLVLVNQHMAKRSLPFLAYRVVFLQQLERQANQIVEIHALVGAQALFVAPHDGGGDALVVVLGLGQRLRRGEAGVLPQADGPLPLASGSGVGAAAAVLQDAGHVIAVQDREVGFQAQHRAVLAHHAHAQRMEGADQHFARRAADQAFGALPHLCGRLVGEGDRGNAPGFQAGLNEPAYLVRDHPRFARTRPGQHKTGAVHEVHRLLLGQVQAGSGGVREGR